MLTIGIAGGTGSGKTTVVRKITEHFKAGEVVVVPQDSYYRDNSDIPLLEDRQKINFDHPSAIDFDLLIQQLGELQRGHSIQQPIYSYLTCTRAEETVTVKPAHIIIVEGILIFQSRELCRQMDIKIYVDTDADVRILRRIVRDVRDRGRSLESVVNQYLTTVKPMHEQFVEPSKRRADIIIPEGGKNQVALEMLVRRVASHLGESAEATSV